MWSRAIDFKGIVHRSWEEEVHGTTMFRLVTKLKRLKSELKKLNREQFNDIENLAKVTALSLTQLQIKLRVDPLNERLFYAERECAKEVEFLARARTDYLKQKSKINWMKEGDENTTFFHTSIKRRKARNRVYQVKGMRGNLCTQHEDVKAAFEEYYISLLGSSNPINPVKRLYNRISCSPRMLMKLDMQKAYDSIEWSFIQELLQYLGFPEIMVNIIMQCVTTPSYSIALNGEFFGFFKGKRGLRQGDPLSPLLFTLCLDYLSRILMITQKHPKFRYHPLCKRIGLSHLCFVDDLILFCKGERASIDLMLNSFHFFSKASGLTMNSDKSNFYCNRMDEDLIQEVERVIGIKKSVVPFKTFLWHGKETRASPAMVAWEKLCMPKRKGGLGLKHLIHWNMAALAKLVQGSSASAGLCAVVDICQVQILGDEIDHWSHSDYFGLSYLDVQEYKSL
ncbi:uncharacterized protein LOC141631595 [Silene latifolia]|uniref:uncharacterized protein LOC141631595 n=1 Tax=Silene latifolia TaxID=37657 RepID=UPI003D76B970